MALEDKDNVAHGLLKELSNSLFHIQHKFWLLRAPKHSWVHLDLSRWEDSTRLIIYW